MATARNAAKTITSEQRPSDVVEFLDSLIREGDGRPTAIVLDNASIHHSIEQDTLDRWFLEHRALLFYLPPYSHPELNLIEIVWKHFKYHWRRFVTWTTQTIDAELTELLGEYGTRFKSISREHLAHQSRTWLCFEKVLLSVRETLINSLTRAGLAWSGAVRAETMDPSR